MRWPRAGAEAGSAAVWVVAACALVMVITTAAGLRGSAVLARHRAEAGADLAALAAAGRIGVGVDECGAAARVAGANGVRLRTCQVSLAGDGRSGAVDVTVAETVRLPMVGARTVLASARAGRLARG